LPPQHKKPHDKTCIWLFEQGEYKNWLDPDKIQEHHGFLWVKGKPEARKSTMMKYALERARTEMATSVITSFFFNARGEVLEKSTQGMYRSLLYQLLNAVPGLPKEFATSPSKKEKRGEIGEWSIEEIKQLLASAIEHLEAQQLVCFIDALDECAEDQVRDMVEFLERLGVLALSARIEFHVSPVGTALTSVSKGEYR
jgi:hypothetical protein